MHGHRYLFYYFIIIVAIVLLNLAIGILPFIIALIPNLADRNYDPSEAMGTFWGYFKAVRNVLPEISTPIESRIFIY